MDELDEFNEAPHSLRSETSSFRDVSGNDMMERIDLDDDDDEEDQSQIINILDRTVPGRIETTDLLTSDNLLIGNLNGDKSSNGTAIGDVLIVNSKNSQNSSHNFINGSQNA